MIPDEPPSHVQPRLRRPPAAGLPVHAQRAAGRGHRGGDGRGGGLVHGAAGRDVRRAHALDDVIPGSSRRRARGPAAGVGLLRVLRRRGAGHRGLLAAGAPPQPPPAVGRRGDGRRRRARRRLSAAEPLRRRAGELGDAAVRLDPRGHPGRGADAGDRRGVRRGIPRGRGPSAVLCVRRWLARHRRPRAGWRSLGGVPVRAGPRGGGDGADHGRAAGLRAAARSRCDRARADSAHRSWSGAERAAGPRDCVGRPGPLLLHQRSRGVLRHQHRAGAVRRGAPCAESSGGRLAWPRRGGGRPDGEQDRTASPLLPAGSR